MIRARLAAGVATALVLIGLAMVVAKDSGASGGTLDQTLIYNPKCSPPAYDGRANSASALMQEFVPTDNSLTGIDICIIPPDDHTISFQIRHGTIEHPGDPIYLGGHSVVYPGADGWVHIDLSGAIVAVGQPLIIELDTAFKDFTWISTCGSIADGCTHIDPDQYPAGKSSVPNADLMFRSYGAPGLTPTPTGHLAVARGDADCNQSIDARDLSDILQYAAGVFIPTPTPIFKAVGRANPSAEMTPGCLAGYTNALADLDCDGQITGRDVLQIALYLASLPELPLPSACAAVGESVIVK
jgi:hypothetical protein